MSVCVCVCVCTCLCVHVFVYVYVRTERIQVFLGWAVCGFVRVQTDRVDILMCSLHVVPSQHPRRQGFRRCFCVHFPLLVVPVLRCVVA